MKNNNFTANKEFGEYFEKLIAQFLNMRGFRVQLTANAIAMPHLYDGTMTNARGDKEFKFEVKARTPRKYFGDFSIMTYHLGRYWKIMKASNTEFYIFVHNMENHICYVSELRNLYNKYTVNGITYPLNKGKFFYFHFDALQPIYEFDMSNNIKMLIPLYDEVEQTV
jgi:hypothetical protein